LQEGFVGLGEKLRVPSFYIPLNCLKRHRRGLRPNGMGFFGCANARRTSEGRCGQLFRHCRFAFCSCDSEMGLLLQLITLPKRIDAESVAFLAFTLTGKDTGMHFPPAHKHQNSA
jgi:hypothetical protein